MSAARRCWRKSGLACDEAGCVRVDATLRSVSHPIVFAAGDCAALEGNPRPKAGVWAVRAGRAAGREPAPGGAAQALLRWKPQQDALILLGLGHGRAVGWRNGLALQGRKIWWLKDRIDQRWMRMYSEFRMAPDPDAAMRCGGCGAKVSAEVLDGALSDAGLVRLTRSAGLAGRCRRDVAAGRASCWCSPSTISARSSTIPYVFGQIAAAHALSDLYAMGAAPWTALAIASVPVCR